jgi:hypothetical protein
MRCGGAIDLDCEECSSNLEMGTGCRDLSLGFPPYVFRQCQGNNCKRKPKYLLEIS